MAYLLELTEGQVVAGSQPPDGFVWKVVCDSAGTVVVRGSVDNRLQVIATARWDGELQAPRQADADTPNEWQWVLLELTLREQHAIADATGDANPINPPALEDTPELAIAAPPIDPVRARELADEILERRANPLSSVRAREIDERLAQRRAEGKPQADPAPKRGRRAQSDRVASDPRTRAKWPAIIALLVMMLLVGVGFTAAFRSCAKDPPETPKPSPPPRRIAIDAPVPVTIDQRVAAAADLKEALVLAQPLSTTLLARYAVAKLRFAELDVAPETTLGHIEKDFRSELGKRMCIIGEVRRIERADMDGRKVFVGDLRTVEGDRIGYLAVGSTGDLVKRSTARFCGVVTDKLQLVGMFDLPENRSPLVEQ